MKNIKILEAFLEEELKDVIGFKNIQVRKRLGYGDLIINLQNEYFDFHWTLRPMNIKQFRSASYLIKKDKLNMKTNHNKIFEDNIAVFFFLEKSTKKLMKEIPSLNESDHIHFDFILNPSCDLENLTTFLIQNEELISELFNDIELWDSDFNFKKYLLRVFTKNPQLKNIEGYFFDFKNKLITFKEFQELLELNFSI